jgi:molybdopterin converting factor subunit 1
MEIDVRYFAAAREAARRDAERVALPDEADLASLVGELERRHPPLAGLSLRYAVNERFAPAATFLGDGDVVALIPPVSGG